MTERPFRPGLTRRVSMTGRPQDRRGRSGPARSEHPVADTPGDTGDGDTTEAEPSASCRLVLSCLAESGGERSIVGLAGDVVRRTDGADPGSPADVQSAFLSVRSSVEELSARGLVTYSGDDGTVRVL